MCGFTWVIQIRPFEVRPQCESSPRDLCWNRHSSSLCSHGNKNKQFFWQNLFLRSRSRRDPATPGSDPASTRSSATKRQPLPRREPSLPHTFSFPFFPHPSFASRFACFHRTDTLKWNFIGLRSLLWPPCHCLLPYVGPFRAVTGSHRSQILQDSVNSYNKKFF